MKQLLIILLGLFSVAHAQFSPTSAKTRFVNGVALGTKLDAAFIAADSNAIYWRADSVLRAKYKGTARTIAFTDALGVYKLISDTFFTAGYTTRARTKQIFDSLGAVKLNISDTSAMLSNYRRSTTKILNSDLANSAITINGTSTALGGSILVGTVTSVGLSSATSGVTIGSSPVTTSGTITLAIATASDLQQGLLSSTDWTTFNNKAPSVAGGYLPLSGGTLTGGLVGTTGSFASNGSSATFAINHTSGSGIGLDITKGGNGEGLRVNKTSGSGNAANITGTLEATTLVKTGGTSSQFLMADGTTSTLTNPVTGTGTTNFLPKFTGASTVGNSQIFDNGTNVGIGTATPRGLLDLNTSRSVKVFFGTAGTIGETQSNASDYIANNLFVNDVIGVLSYTKITGDNGNAILQDFFRGITFYSGVTGANTTTGNLSSFERMRLNASGNLGIGTTSPESMLTLNGTTPFIRIERSGVNTWQIQNNNNVGTLTGFSINNISAAITPFFINQATGNLLLGTTTDNGARLQVSGAGTFTSTIAASGATLGTLASGSDAILNLATNASGSPRSIIYRSATAFIDITNTAGTAVFQLSNGGAATFSSSVTASSFFESSDLRLKNIVKRDGDVVYFNWKNKSDSLLHIGYIAQEVQKTNPDQVKADEKGMLSVNYTEILVQKVRELEKQIAELQKRIK